MHTFHGQADRCSLALIQLHTCHSWEKIAFVAHTLLAVQRVSMRVGTAAPVKFVHPPSNLLE